MPTPPLTRPKSELRAAENALARMKGAQSFHEFEAAWKEVLGALEKSWSKIEKECKAKSSRAQPWLGKYVKFRCNDALLRYLHHARNADHHTLEDSVQYLPGEYSFTLGRPGQSVYVASLRIDHTGRVVQYQGSARPEIVDRPARIRLLPVLDRRVSYQVPTEHLGVAFRSDPVSVAQAGLNFYKELLAETEKKFFSGSPSK